MDARSVFRLLNRITTGRTFKAIYTVYVNQEKQRTAESVQKVRILTAFLTGHARVQNHLHRIWAKGIMTLEGYALRRKRLLCIFRVTEKDWKENVTTARI